MELNTSLRVPLGRMVLVGGMTVDATTPDTTSDVRPSTRPASHPATPSIEPQQLYLFVEVTAD